MRYWIYKDAQIIGPMSPEEVLHIDGAASQLLLCPDGADGSRESDWKTAGEIPELAQFFRDRAPEMATALRDPELQTWPIRDFSPEELVGLPFFQFWEPPSVQSHQRFEDLDTQRRRSQDWEGKFAGLEEKILQYERRQGEILDRLAEKDKLLENQEKEIQRLQKELEQSHTLPIPKPSEKKPEVFDVPPVTSLAPASYEPVSPWSFAPPTPASTPPSVVWTPDTFPTPSASAPVPASPVSAFTPDPMPVPTLAPEIMPPFTEPPSVGLAALASSSTSLPPPSNLPSNDTPLASDPHTPDPFSLPNTAISAPSSREIPDFSWASASVTRPREELGQFESPALGAPTEIKEVPIEVSSSQPSSSSAVSKSGRGKKLMLAAAVIAIGAVAGFVYLSEDTKKTDMTSLDTSAANPPTPNIAPVPPSSNISSTDLTASNPVQGGASSNPSTVSPAATMPSAQTPEIATTQEAKQGSSNPENVADRSQEAIDLVKNYSLDGGRGSIGKSLQDSYPSGGQEKWSANPGDSAGVYMVQYQVAQENPTSPKTESPLYVFQVDVSEKSVQGFNGAAKDLIAGSIAPKPAAKKTHKKHHTLKPGEIPLLPLPSDRDLPHTAHRSVDAEQ